MLMRTPSQSLTVQLAARFAERIRSRLLAPGAREQGVSVSTVVAAYDQLQAQGLVVSRKNSGFLCVMLHLMHQTGPQPNQNLRNQLLT